MKRTTDEYEYDNINELFLCKKRNIGNSGVTFYNSDDSDNESEYNESDNELDNESDDEDDKDISEFKKRLRMYHLRSKKNVEVIKKCENPRCDHTTFYDNPTPANIFKGQIESIDDLIELGYTYHCKKNTEYIYQDLKLCLKLCYDIVEPLLELKNMVGMENIKKQLIGQIMYCLRKYHSNDMLHTVITGPPGVGKTELAKIIGNICKKLKVIGNGIVKKVSRADLIGKYVGHTAPKVQAVIDECRGGVLIIDEAYSLGSERDNDTFSKEAIDTLTYNLEKNRNFICIIIGYKDALQKCFFDKNEGLDRRFAFRYNIENYDSEQLCEIFTSKINNDDKWDFNYGDENEFKIELSAFFKNNLNNFPNYGGDMETLVMMSKTANAIDIKSSSFKLSMNDISRGYQMYLENQNSTKYNITKHSSAYFIGSPS